MVLRPVPGLHVTVCDRVADGVAARLAVSGPVRYRIGGGPSVTASAFAVEPSSAGVLVHSAVGGDEALRVVRRPMEFRLERDTEAVLDGHPMLLPSGVYLIESRPDAFHRIVLA